MGRRFDRCLAIIFWVLTPPAQWIMEWFVRHRRKALTGVEECLYSIGGRDTGRDTLRPIRGG